MIGQTSLASLPSLRSYESKRISSWDTTGANTDAWRIEAGEKRVIGQIDGPGCIKHIWMTLGLPAEDYCRRIVLRIYWMDQRNRVWNVPSVISLVSVTACARISSPRRFR